jgi:hypothetical protein
MLSMGFLLCTNACWTTHETEGTSENRIASEIRSDEDLEVAWGAHAAGRSRSPFLQERVREKLVALAEASEPNPFLVMLLLDALILSRASIGASRLLPFASRFPVQTAILMAQQETPDIGSLYAVFLANDDDERGHRMVWQAVGDMLTKREHKGFVRHLMKTLEFRQCQEIGAPPDAQLHTMFVLFSIANSSTYPPIRLRIRSIGENESGANLNAT